MKEGGPAWERLLNLIPALRSQFAAATPERSFTHLPRLSFRGGAIAGKRWALLPSSAGFVDPLLSTGFTLTLMGVARLAEAIEQKWESDGFNARLLDYSAQTDNELLATSRLVASLYETMGTFPVFVALLMIYFARQFFGKCVETGQAGPGIFISSARAPRLRPTVPPVIQSHSERPQTH